MTVFSLGIFDSKSATELTGLPTKLSSKGLGEFQDIHWRKPRTHGKRLIAVEVH